MTTGASTAPTAARRAGALTVVPFSHPQGCRAYLLADGSSREALAIDVHLDLVRSVADRVRAEGWSLRYVVDTHTHADHPSGSAALAEDLGAERVAHAEGRHAGVTIHPTDGDRISLGEEQVTIRFAPGHTPDHIVLLTEGALFAGDTLLIGGVARTDFLGGDAGTLYDSLRAVLEGLPDETLLYPGHDYEGREHSTVGAERAGNPWLAMGRDDFVRQLTANPPPRPTNMDALLRLNREGVDIPASIAASDAASLVEAGGGASVIDVRSGVEYEGEHVPGSRLIPLDRIADRADEVRATPAPRLLLCRTGARAEMAREALAALSVSGLSVIEGGMEAFTRAGGPSEKGREVMSIERQVRIGSGLLVLLGVALGFFLHPGFHLLAAFIGAGQVFAGTTDWCGMGLLLARAPWNRSAAEQAGPAADGACAATAPGACAAGPPSACAAAPPAKD